MLKKIAALSTSVLMLLGMTGCTLTKQDMIEVTDTREVPPQMVFFGDSIPDGFGLEGFYLHSNSECASYPNLLRDKYAEELLDEDCETKMSNFAVSGHKSQDMIDLINKGGCDDALKDADAIVISIGGNDMLYIIYEACTYAGVKFNGTSVNLDNVNLNDAAETLVSFGDKIDDAIDKFSDNIDTIVGLLDERSDAVIYFQTLYNPFEPYCETPVIGDFMMEKMTSFNDTIKSKASGKYEVVDIAAAFDGEAVELTNIKKNDVHPNADGHALIADEVDKAFRSTGFKYTHEELSDPKLTGLAYGLIIGGFVLMIAVLVFISKMFRKKS